MINRRSHWIHFLLIFFMLAQSAAFPGPARAQSLEGENPMQAIANQMQPGWNLGNTLDASGGETSWGNPKTTKDMIDAIAAAGFKSIRVPVTWGFRSGPGPDYIIDPEAIERVKQIVNWSLENHLYVIINLHHEYEWLHQMENDYVNVVTRFKSYWTQLADAFADYPAELMFEGLNEPRYDDDWGKNDVRYFTWLDELNTHFHEIVRSSGGTNATRPLLLPTLVCATDQPRMDELYKTILQLDDPNLIATVHYYGPYHFSVNVGGVTTFTPAVRNDIDAMLDRCVNTFQANGIPVIIGEYGLLAFDSDMDGVEHGEMLKFFDHLTAAARERSITLMWWDNGQHFDRRALTWRDPYLLDTIIYNVNARAATAERDYILLKQRDLITDQSIALHLNGNELTGVYAGERLLNNPADYRFDGEKLTITSDYLLTLPSQPLGEAAVLRCVFTGGPDWIIHVSQYDTPVLKPTTYLGSMLDIPVDFNGERLSTMQAYKYINGKNAGNAGPDNWTPYQQYSRTYSPSYEKGKITLTQAFFDSLEDGEYLLRFHFLSGSKPEYIVIKEGKTLTGAPVVKAEPAPSSSPAPSPEPTQSPSPEPAAEAPTTANEPATDENWLLRAWRKPVVKAVTGGSAALVLLAVTAKALLRKRK